MSAPPKADQQARFIEAARAIGVDEDEAAFKAKLAVIGARKPAEPPTAPTATPKRKATTK